MRSFTWARAMGLNGGDDGRRTWKGLRETADKRPFSAAASMALKEKKFEGRYMYPILTVFLRKRCSVLFSRPEQIPTRHEQHTTRGLEWWLW